VRIGETSVLKLADWAGLVAEVRKDIVLCRLSNLLEFGDLNTLRIDTLQGSTVLRSNLGLLVTVDPASAALEQADDEYVLAAEWMHRIKVASYASRPTERSAAFRELAYVEQPKSLDSAEVPVVMVSSAEPVTLNVAQVIEGTASWYGPGFHGRQTASGEVFDQDALTAAHRTLPFGTRLRVIDISSGRSVEVVINDRGPFIDGRVLDLSKQAASQLGMIDRGLATVRAEVLPRAY
jgi:rare lipoprotein A